MRTDVRIAVTGAAGVVGKTLRTALAERKVPSEQLRFLDRATDEAILSEYAGQATLIGALEPEAIADSDVVFLCGPTEESETCLGWERRIESICVDLSGAALSRPGVPVVNLSVNGGALDRRPRLVAAPHPISLAVTSVLLPIDRAAAIERCAGVVLRPVSDFGEEAVDELVRQTVSLFNFETIPKDVLGRQMAFNVVPQAAYDADHGQPALNARLASEVDRIMGWKAPRATMRVLVAPVFHGHVAQLHLTLGGAADAPALRRALGATEGIVLPGRGRSVSSPVEAAAQDGADMTVDLLGDGVDSRSCWISIVGSRLTEGAAGNAVEIAGRLLSG